MKYRVLNGKIHERGIRQSAICKSLGISQRAFRNKMRGITEFTWSQACLIQRVYFPDMSKDDLFYTFFESVESDKQIS